MDIRGFGYGFAEPPQTSLMRSTATRYSVLLFITHMQLTSCSLIHHPPLKFGLCFVRPTAVVLRRLRPLPNVRFLVRVIPKYSLVAPR